MKQNMSKQQLSFFVEFNNAMRTFSNGYGEHLYNEIKQKDGEMTPNFLIPITGCLIVSDDNRKLYPTYGQKFLTYCNSDKLDELCNKHKVDRFSKISKKKYFELFMEIAKDFGMQDKYENAFLSSMFLTA